MRVHRRLMGEGGPINPLTLADLELMYWSPAITGVADGTAVNPWQDSSPHNRDASKPVTTTRAPLYRSSGANLTPNGSPSVEWEAPNTAGSQCLSWAWGSVPAVTNGLTIYAYTKGTAAIPGGPPNGGKSSYLFGCGFYRAVHFHEGTGNNFAHAGRYAARMGYNAGGTDAADGRCYDAYSQNAWQILTIRGNPPTNTVNRTDAFEFFRAGTKMTVFTQSADNRWGSSALAATGILGNLNDAGINKMGGNMAAFLVFSTAHSEALRAGIEAYILQQLAE